MESSASIPTGDLNRDTYPNNHLSKWKTYGFAIAIIVVIGGLAVAGVGLGGFGVPQGWWQAGALSNLGQINSIIMISVCGVGGGVVFLITVIVSVVKNCQKRSHSKNIESNRYADSTPSISTVQNEKITPTETQVEVVYGKEAWSCWNAQVVGEVLPPPPINWDDKDPFFPGKSLRETSMLVFIPEEIIVNGKQQPLTLNILKEIIKYQNKSSQQYNIYSELVQRVFGNTPIKSKSGWVLITKDLIPDSRKKSYDDHKDMVEKKGYRMPNAGEVTIGILMHHAYTGEQLYGKTFTVCAEQLQGRYPVFVGGFEPDGLSVFYFQGFNANSYGVTAVR